MNICRFENKNESISADLKNKNELISVDLKIKIN